MSRPETPPRRVLVTSVALGAAGLTLAAALSACGGQGITVTDGKGTTMSVGADGVQVQGTDGASASFGTGGAVIDGGDGTKVTIGPDGKVDATSTDGSFSGGIGTTLPADFPAQIPTPEGTIVSAVSSKEDSGPTWLVIWSVPDAKAAYEAYRSRIEAAGFTKSDEVVGNSGGSYSVLAGFTNGTWEVSVTGGDGGDGPNLSLAVTKPTG